MATVHVHVFCTAVSSTSCSHARALDVGVELERTWSAGTFAEVLCGLWSRRRDYTGRRVVPTGAAFEAVLLRPDDRGVGAILASARLRAVLPEPPILMYFIFPVPAKYFVAIMGGISLLSAIEGGGGGVCACRPARRTASPGIST